MTRSLAYSIPSKERLDLLYKRVNSEIEGINVDIVDEADATSIFIRFKSHFL